MIQDIYPLHLDNSFDPKAVPRPQDSVMLLSGKKIAAGSGSELVFPSLAELPDIKADRLVYLFRVGTEDYYLYDCDDLPELPDGFSLRSLTELREASSVPQHRLFAAFTAKHLADWYRDNRFCGRCGAPTRFAGTKRTLVCPVCRNSIHPKIMPAVIVGVKNGDELLVTRYRTGFPHNALVAGFTEIGETLEETVSREVMEETGLKVCNIRYYKSQPWGTAGDILAGFWCEADGSSEIRMDARELGSAVWTRREDIVLQPDDASLTNEMLRMFRDGME